ncbi:MAG: hypothetical protein Q9O62_04120 [Ardenticatenia bacterium]|nr:hypothetical protein [Ardenticatenia bacterium]
MRLQDVRRGCLVVVAGLPVCGFLVAGVGGLVVVLVLLLFTLIGCASPPTTVGYIAYPPDGVRVPAGEMVVQLRAYRRGWATLQVDSGWSASSEPPETISLTIDGQVVFRWAGGDSGPPREVPVSLVPGEHTLSLTVYATGYTVQDTVTVTAVPSRVWRSWRVPELTDPSAWLLFTDASGELWRVARPRPEIAGAFVDVISWRTEGALPPEEHYGVILAADGERARFLSLTAGRDITLTLAVPLPAKAHMGTLYVGAEGPRELLWFPAWPLERWNGRTWAPTSLRVPLSTSVNPHVELVWPDDVWYWSRGRNAARWDGTRWQIIPAPPGDARLIRAAVALEGRTFFVWTGKAWQPTAPVPAPQDPFALDFAALNSERRVLRCGGSLWMAGNAASWDADDPEAGQRVRLFRWDKRAWTWQDVRPSDEYSVGFLACVGNVPWFIAQRGGKRRLQAGAPQVANRLGGRFLGPEAGIPLDVVRLWQWQEGRWRPAVHAPLWGQYAADVLPGSGLGVASFVTERVAVASP